MSRIKALPRRVWSDEADAVVREMTEFCRTENGTMSLRPIQALNLLEASERGGVLANVRTGGGKTLLSGLLPFVLGSQKPILFVPANLRQKTRLEFQKLRQHWKIPKTLRIESYEMLGLTKNEQFLVHYEPDLIICDEAHMIKRVQDSARARRIARFMKYFPQTKFCAMTGTLGDLTDFAHTLIWCLRDGAPIPTDPDEINAWSKVLNVKVQEWERGNPEILVPHLGKEALDFPRAAFRDRLVHTPGVIVSVDTFDGCGLIVKPRYCEPSEATEQAFAELRTTWEMPDGWELADASFEVWHSARQLALGFYKMHDPRPPAVWRDVRKQYCKFCRLVTECSENYDTELQVRQALESGVLKTPIYEPGKRITPEMAKKEGVLGKTIFEAWQHIAGSYTPEVYPVWHSEHVLENVTDWGRSAGANGGIIWVDSVDFATALHKKTNWPYFHHMGKDERGRFIESDRVHSTETIICSIDSNKTGRNLQHKWHKNLIVDPMSKGDDWEQLVSRTHREGQKRDTVFVDYLITSYEYYSSIYNAVQKNEIDHETIGQNYRLLNADLIMPTLVGRKGEYVWQPTSKKNKVTI